MTVAAEKKSSHMKQFVSVSGTNSFIWRPGGEASGPVYRLKIALMTESAMPKPAPIPSPWVMA